MSSVLGFVAWAGWLILAATIAYAAGTVLRFNVDDPPLLVRCYDHADQRHLLDRSLAEDREVALLDGWFALPDGTPRA